MQIIKMAMHGNFMKFFSIWGNCRNVLGTTNRSLPNIQQVAMLRKDTLAEINKIPPKPKRPLTPYFKYMMQLRPELKKQNPNGKLTDLVKETAVRWEKVDPKLKMQLDEEYKKEQEIYAKQKLEFDTNLTEEQRAILKEVRDAKMEDRLKRKYRKKCKDYNKPKKPCSAYVLYLKTQLPNRGTENFKEWQMTISKKWNALSEEEKRPFMEEMKDSFKEYQIKMNAWEKEMIKLGNLDIVRQDALIDPKATKAKPKKMEKTSQKKTQ